MLKSLDVHKDARRLMEMAVDEMRKSIAEPRGDGKSAPKVGAVLVKPDGSVESSHRGELRHGDHAEYTVLEKKNRAVKLDGSTLFATLEPCAPGARHIPKMGCAERIVSARVKEVWVGIEDPDPTVDRKGIKFLQDHGILVNMFDLDLQKVIREENQDFIDQALERAEDAKNKPEDNTLSDLEKVDKVGMDFLSSEALETFRGAAGIVDDIESEAFHERLIRLGLAELVGSKMRPTGFGALLFAKEPREIRPQAALMGTIHFADGTEEIETFDGPQALAPQQAMKWLRDKLPKPINRSEAQRRESNEALFRIVREGLVNALVHRDYDIQGAKCQLIVTPDKIEIWSPGAPVAPITLEQMKSFNAPMLSRNPILHYVFTRMKLAEERGLGLKSMQDTAARSGLPLPQYSSNGVYLILTVLRSAEAAAKVLRPETLESLSSAEREGWQWLSTRTHTTSIEYAEGMGIPYRTAMNHLKRFITLNLLRRGRSGKNIFYEVVPNAKQN